MAGDRASDEQLRKLMIGDDIRRATDGLDEEYRRLLRDVNGTNSWREEALKAVSPHLGDLARISTLSEDANRALRVFDHDFNSALAVMNTCPFPAIEEMRHQYEAQFRAPVADEVRRLSEEFNRSSVTALLETEISATAHVRRMLEASQLAYLKDDALLASVSALAEIQHIGMAVRATSTFSRDFAQALRADLGDWRDLISWKNGIELCDPAVRLSLYVERGFDVALTDFPEATFNEILESSGLSPDLSPPLDRQSVWSVPYEGSEAYGEGLERLRVAYSYLASFEMCLRDFIDQSMTRVYGSNWMSRRLPNGLYDCWLEKKERAERVVEGSWRLIDFADFTDYERIICKKDNWRDVFSPLFSRADSAGVRESLQRLYPVRLCTMHARPITKDDQMFLYVEVRRLAKVIGL